MTKENNVDQEGRSNKRPRLAEAKISTYFKNVVESRKGKSQAVKKETNGVNKSSQDQADLFPISMSNLSNSSSQEQEEIKPEIVNNINSEDNLDHYHMEYELGEGGFGRVIAATRKADNVPVAIKFVDKRSVNDFKEVNGEKIPAEVYWMIKVQHRHVIKIYDFFSMGNYFAYVMERPGNCQDLGSILFDRTMTEKEARRYFAQIIEANIKCEENRFIQRDLKPENVLVDLDADEVKLIDFGLASEIQYEPYNVFRGTRVYMAPEYFRFGWYDGCQATVWALGMILVGMLSPYMAFSKPEQAYGRPPRIPRHLSPEAKNLISSLLNVVPMNRQILNHPWFAMQGSRETFSSNVLTKRKSCDKENELSSVTLCGLPSLSLTKEEETDRAELITKHYTHSSSVSASSLECSSTSFNANSSRDSKGSHSFESSSSSARTSSEVEPSESFAEIRNTSKLTAVNEDIQETDCDIFQPLVVLCVMRYCGYQATVWALVLIVLDMHSPHMALSESEQVHERPLRIPRLLSPGSTEGPSSNSFGNIKDKSYDEERELPSATSNCLSSLVVTKEEVKHREELIATKHCSYSKCVDTRVHSSEAEKLRFGWYDGCQAMVWALEMILLESRSLYLLSRRTYTVFSKPEKAFKRPRRIPEHLTPGSSTCCSLDMNLSPSGVTLTRNKAKATEKLSAPIRKNGLEYEERFHVERKRRFLAVIFVILLSRITLKNLPTFTCLLDYCRMHKHKTHQISHKPALAERAQQKLWGVTGCP
ncbi:unnamed protein product [Porites evermanni]|uniref:non-specific serine/threonine protein kinase n=1 Tax=Porites evermanni TaxID=104178 RepID=A0ABN8LZS1_9CNID|nr:unnamed protein product [Porites evermanni]